MFVLIRYDVGLTMDFSYTLPPDETSLDSALIIVVLPFFYNGVTFNKVIKFDDISVASTI